MDYLIFFLLGWAIGSMYTTYKHLKAIKQIAEEQGINFDDMVNNIAKTEAQTVPVFIAEKQGSIIYLYDKKSNTFVTQGSSYEELAKKTMEHNKVSIAMVIDGDKEFWFYKGQLKNRVDVLA